MIAIHDFALYMAKQTARGVYPTDPTYCLEIIDGGLKSNPTIAKLNLCDGRIFGTSKKRITYIETGGQPTVTGQPMGMGAVFAWCWGNDSPAGGGDPYTHTIVPPTTLTGFPYVTFWQKLDDQWCVFHDCQIVDIEIEWTNRDDGFMRIKPLIVGFAKEQACAAPTPASEETDIVHWLDGGGYHVLGGDYANMERDSVPTDLAELKAWLTAFKVHFNAHCAVSSGLHHKAADATNTLGYADNPADLAACIVCLTEIRAELIDHEALTTTHYFADTTDNNPSSAWIEPCVTLDDCLAAAQDCIGGVNSPGCYNRHLGATPGINSVKMGSSMQATPWQGEAVTAYTVIRKPGTITMAVEMLQEDFRLINLAKFGDPAPAAGTEVTTEIQNLSMYHKFTASTTGAERSIAISVPQFDLDAEPLMSLMDNPEGSEPVLTIGGEATGTAPICTVTVIGPVAAY